MWDVVRDGVPRVGGDCISESLGCTLQLCVGAAVF